MLFDVFCRAETGKEIPLVILSANQTRITYDPAGHCEDDGKGREALLAAFLIFLPGLPPVLFSLSLSLYSVFHPFFLLHLHLAFLFAERSWTHRDLTSDHTMDMSSESSTARWYEPPRSSLEPPSGGAGVAGVVGNPGDYRGYYPHAGPTAHHPAAAAHYAHSKYTRFLPSFLFFKPPLTFLLSLSLCVFFLSENLASRRFNDRALPDVFFEKSMSGEANALFILFRAAMRRIICIILELIYYNFLSIKVRLSDSDAPESREALD